MQEEGEMNGLNSSPKKIETPFWARANYKAHGKEVRPGGG